MPRKRNEDTSDHSPNKEPKVVIGMFRQRQFSSAAKAAKSSYPLPSVAQLDTQEQVGITDQQLQSKAQVQDSMEMERAVTMAIEKLSDVDETQNTPVLESSNLETQKLDPQTQVFDESYICGDESPVLHPPKTLDKVDPPETNEVKPLEVVASVNTVDELEEVAQNIVETFRALYETNLELQNKVAECTETNLKLQKEVEACTETNLKLQEANLELQKKYDEFKEFKEEINAKLKALKDLL